MRKTYNLPCPIANALEVIGDRWTILVLRELFFGRHRYREFQDNLVRIPPNLLTERLRLLEQEGIVLRQIYSDSPLRADYTLTQKGQELIAVLTALAQWGEHYYPSEDGTRYDAIHEGCGGVIVNMTCTVCQIPVGARETRVQPSATSTV